MDRTSRDLRRWAGWAMPRIASFDIAALAGTLGLLGPNPCRARMQGRCEGRNQCVDCAWSEDALERRK